MNSTRKQLSLTPTAFGTYARPKTKMPINGMGRCCAAALALTAALVGGTIWGRAECLYVGNGDGTIMAYPLNGNAGFAFSSAIREPGSLAFDRSGNLFVGNTWGLANTVYRISQNGSVSPYGDVGFRPYGLAVDAAGNVYASGETSIVKISPSGTQSVFASGLNGALALTFSAAGDLYVADAGDNTIVKFTANGVRSTFATAGLNLPTCLAFDSVGNLYAGNINYPGYIERFTPDGIGSLFGADIWHPSGMAFDSAGDLYVANNYGNQIWKFTPDGGSTIFAETDPRYPLSLTIGPDPVPEPSMSDLFGVGILSLGLCRRLNNRAPLNAGSMPCYVSGLIGAARVSAGR